MIANIEELKYKLDEKIVSLSLMRLSEERFQTCMSDVSKKKLATLLSYQSILERMLEVEQTYQPPVFFENLVAVYNEFTGKNENHKKTTEVTYFSNCIKKLTITTPVYSSELEKIVTQETIDYEQVLDCEDLIYQYFPCAKKFVEQINSLI